MKSITFSLLALLSSAANADWICTGCNLELSECVPTCEMCEWH